MVVTDTNAQTLYDLHDMQLEPTFVWARDVAWVGNGCVLYEAGKSTNRYLRTPTSYFVFNLKSGKSTTAFDALGISDKALEGLVAYNFPNTIVKNVVNSAHDVGLGYSLISQDGTRTSLGLEHPSEVQLLADLQADGLPTECK